MSDSRLNREQIRELVIAQVLEQIGPVEIDWDENPRWEDILPGPDDLSWLLFTLECRFLALERCLTEREALVCVDLEKTVDTYHEKIHNNS